MPAGYAELFLEQGADFNTTVTLDDVSGSPINLIPYTATSQMRKSYYSSNASGTFITNTQNYGDLGILSLSMYANTTANIASGRYLYDVYITQTGGTDRIRVLEGIVNVMPQVTKTPGML